MSMFKKLYPFSSEDMRALRAYSNKLSDMSFTAEKNGNYEEADKLFNRSCHVGFFDAYFDGVVYWLKGKEIGEAKKILAEIA